MPPTNCFRLFILMSWLEYIADPNSTPTTQLTKPWWQPLLSLINFILLGYVLKTFFGWGHDRVTKYRRFTFNVLLPLYVLRNMWLARIDSAMFNIAKFSFFLHVLQALFWAIIYRNVNEKCMRGWLLMISQGCLTSFFYTNLSTHSNFGQQAVAVCLLFDIGGNTPCAQGLLWGIAAYFAPDRTKDRETPEFETAFSSPLLLRSFPKSSPSTFSQFGGSKPGDSRWEEVELGPLLEPNSPINHQHTDRSFSSIIFAVFYQPVLPAFAFGLVLSLYNVGCPLFIDYSLETLGLFFKPSLYLLIGLYSEVITDIAQLRIILTAIGLRYLFAGFLGLMMWLWLPFGEMERTTMALSFLSPVSTMTMYLAAEHKYPNQFVAMSAALTTVSVFVSFIIQEAVLRSF